MIIIHVLVIFWHCLLSSCCGLSLGLVIYLSGSSRFIVVCGCHVFLMFCHVLGIFHHVINLRQAKMTKQNLPKQRQTNDKNNDKMELPCSRGWGQAQGCHFPEHCHCFIICLSFGCHVLSLLFFRALWFSRHVLVIFLSLSNYLGIHFLSSFVILSLILESGDILESFWNLDQQKT